MNVNWDTYAHTFPTRYLKHGSFDATIDRQLKRLNLLHGVRRAAPPTILEIGGGTTGCPSLQAIDPEDLQKTRQTPDEAHPLIWTNVSEMLDLPGCVRADARYMVWFLDPFVTEVPRWVVQNLAWDHAEFGFDLIIARGCINYLTPEQIGLITGMLSKSNGVFIANTFEHPPVEGCREVTNQAGEPLLESILWKPPFVHHCLTPVGGGEPIEHTFRHYNREQYLEMLGGHPLRTRHFAIPNPRNVYAWDRNPKVKVYVWDWHECRIEVYGTNSLQIRVNRV